MLTRLYNLFYSENIIPELWKRSLICPIYKGGQKTDSTKLSTHFINKQTLQTVQ